MAPADNWKRAQLDDPFWAEQFAGLAEPHVAPINELVDRLSHAKGAVRLPHAAPWHGGIHAPVLSVLNDPGEEALVPDFLCLRNPDRASDRQRHLMTEFDIDPADFCPWNGYPWPRENKKDLTPEEALEGGRALLEIMSLMTNLRLLLLLGRKATGCRRCRPAGTGGDISAVGSRTFTAPAWAPKAPFTGRSKRSFGPTLPPSSNRTWPEPRC